MPVGLFCILLSLPSRELVRIFMIVRFKRRFAVPLLVLSALGLAGCSGSSGDDLPREAVSGTVTLDGAPLPSGSISFSPDGGGRGRGGRHDHGRQIFDYA